MEFKVLFRSKIFAEIKISLKTKSNVESWIDFGNKRRTSVEKPKNPK